MLSAWRAKRGGRGLLEPLKRRNAGGMEREGGEEERERGEGPSRAPDGAGRNAFDSGMSRAFQHRSRWRVFLDGLGGWLWEGSQPT